MKYRIIFTSLHSIQARSAQWGSVGCHNLLFTHLGEEIFCKISLINPGNNLLLADFRKIASKLRTN